MKSEQGSGVKWERQYELSYACTDGLHCFNQHQRVQCMNTGRGGTVTRRSPLTADIRWDDKQDETIEQLDPNIIVVGWRRYT